MSIQVSIRVSKEHKDKLVELAKEEGKTITQYILDRTVLADGKSVETDNTRVESMLQEQIEQLRADFERERAFYASQIEKKDEQIAEINETNQNQLQLIAGLTMRNETLLIENNRSWWQKIFGRKNKSN
ncbi:hypothetical protein ACVR0O_10300 [Streptococcus caviae]|uniref:hypothetical protein n=1 Tax=Streptococcus sp. 'caviae' TaxID=1915004 RepID=UPI00094B9478|nr:hypothetical protein [Streptococcus sp. 'caviae']OLN82157.1 hypothetical protein BMI76_10170 [Streptococcus sp. 'caviae']